MLLTDMVLFWANSQPDKIAFRYVCETLDTVEQVTYKEFHDRSIRLSTEISRDTRVTTSSSLPTAFILYNSGIQFIISFVACLLAGIIAVPVAVPKKSQKITRMLALLEDSTPSLVLTNSGILENLSSDIRALLIEKIFLTDHCLSSKKISSDFLSDNKREINDIAFLQYTSGSTGTPKGVIVTHANILSNLSMLKNALKVEKESVFVTWLPLFHDMGLVGNILLSLYYGCTCIFTAPTNFIKRPKLWLDMVTEYRATITGGPNFSYDLCVQHVNSQERQTINLSTLKATFNGAEPIDSKTLIRFIDYFKPSGFNENAFFTCYGLAEATLFVSGTYYSKIKYENPKTLYDYMSVGTPSHGIAIRIVDDNIEECPPYTIGEICIAGDNVAIGYWKDSVLTKNTFETTISDNPQRFLKTGDLGFIDKDSNLFITGRKKNLIIKNGCKYHPEQIELAIKRSVDRDLISSIIIFTTLDSAGKDKTVVLVEPRRSKYRTMNHSKIVDSIRSAVFSDYELRIDQILVIRPFSIPRTTSGKIQRVEAKKLYDTGQLQYSTVFDLNTVDNPRKTRLLDKNLEDIITSALEIKPSNLKLNASLISHGIDSIKVVILQDKLQKYFNKIIPFETLLDPVGINQVLLNIEKL